MEGLSAYEPHPKKDESDTERANPGADSDTERSNPYLHKKHIPGLRAALFAAVASIIPTVSPPTEAATARKPLDEIRQQLSQEEMDALKERQRIVEARMKRTPDETLEKKHPGLTMRMDDLSYSFNADAQKRSEEVANEVGRFMENARQMADRYQSVGAALLEGKSEYRSPSTDDEMQATDLLRDIFKITNAVESTYPKIQDLGERFVQSPDVQTAARIQDLNQRMREFFSLPQAAQDSAIGEAVHQDSMRTPQTPSYPSFFQV